MYLLLSFSTAAILPDAGTFWKIVELYKVSCIMTAPTALRAIQRDDPDAKLMSSYNLSSLRSMFLAGERSEPGIVSRYQGLLSKLANPAAVVIDNYWSTESGSPITGIQLTKGFPPLAPRPGSAGLPLPGMDVRIVDDEGVEVKTGEMGNIVLGQVRSSALLSLPSHRSNIHCSFNLSPSYTSIPNPIKILLAATSTFCTRNSLEGRSSVQGSLLRALREEGTVVRYR